MPEYLIKPGWERTQNIKRNKAKTGDLSDRYRIFDLVAILLRRQQTEFLKLKNETAYRGVSGVAEVTLELFGGEFAATVCGQDKVPKAFFLLGDFTVIQRFAENVH